MDEVNAVKGPASLATLRVFADQATRQAESAAPAAVGDRVEISELANFLGRLAELPEERARKIVEVRDQIANGTYETQQKMDVVVERLMNEL